MFNRRLALSIRWSVGPCNSLLVTFLFITLSLCIRVLDVFDVLGVPDVLDVSYVLMFFLFFFLFFLLPFFFHLLLLLFFFFFFFFVLFFLFFFFFLVAD